MTNEKPALLFDQVAAHEFLTKNDPHLADVDRSRRNADRNDGRQTGCGGYSAPIARRPRRPWLCRISFFASELERQQSLDRERGRIMRDKN